MHTIPRYKGRDITQEDVLFIKELIARHPGDSRRALSRKLCKAWNWVQPNGQLKDMVCRELMPALHRQGQITLPPAGKTAVKPGCNRRKPVLVQVDQTPLFSALKDITRHPIYYLETFVDQERFKGTCYFAANWLYLGQTTGRGKNDQTGRANLSLKAVLGYPLTSDFRKKLCEVPW